MTSKSQFVFLLVLASWSLTSQPRAQAPIDRPVSSGDLLGGYVPNGEWIEVTGHAWVSDKGMFFNFNQPSARFPMRVDIANVDPEHSRRLNSECRSLDQFRGGCWFATWRRDSGSESPQGSNRSRCSTGFGQSSRRAECATADLVQRWKQLPSLASDAELRMTGTGCPVLVAPATGRGFCFQGRYAVRA